MDNIDVLLANKLDTVGDQLKLLSRQLESLQPFLHFLKHKFQPEFEEFLCEQTERSASDDEDTPNSSVARSTSSSTNETNRIQRNDRTYSSTKIYSDGTLCEGVNSRDQHYVKFEEESFHSSGFVNRIEESEFCHTKVNQMRLSDNGNEEDPLDSNAVPRKFKVSNSPSGATLPAAILSSSSSVKRELRQVEEDRANCLLNRPVSLWSTVKSPCGEETSTRSDTTGKRRQSSDYDSESVGESDEDDEVSSASGESGENTVNSSTSKDSLESESGVEMKSREAGVPTQKTKRQQTKIDSTLDMKCPTCNQTFKSQWNLNLHKQIHNPEKKFKCLLCPKSFHQKISLQRHELIHADEKPFKCSFCPKFFRHQYSTRRHERTHQRPQ